MHHVEPPISPGRTTASSRLAFIAATASVVAVFAAVGATIPLFNIYRADDGLTNAGISMAVVAYSVATLGTLLVFGRVSNHLGRKPPSLAALGLMISGSLILMTVHGVGVLICGRLLMGLGAGLASTSLTAYIVDAAPDRPSWLAPVASSQTVMLGLAVGAIVSGTLVQYAPWPRTLSLWAVTGLLSTSALLVTLSPETASRTHGTWRSLRPTFRAPTRVRPLIPAAAAVLLATWATGAFYQAFVPALVQQQLHTDNSLAVGVAFAAYMGSSALGAPLSSRFKTGGGQRVAILTFLGAWAGIVTAIATGHLATFFVATVVAGVSQGVGISAVTQGLLRGAVPSERAPILTVVYLLSYTSATVPSLVAARLSTTVSLSCIVWGYAVLVLLATVAMFVADRLASPGVPTRNRGASANEPV
jgi:MFS family permease